MRWLTEDTGGPQRIEAQLTAIDPGLENAVPLVLEVLGQREPGAPGPAAKPDISGVAGVLQRVLRVRGAREPLVVVLDDAHSMDSSSHALVRELLTSVLDSRVLVIANFRSEFRPSWIGGSRYHQLALSPLGETASHELLSELLGADASLGELPDRIQERTAGNPLFTEEVVQALVAGGSLAGERGAYRLTAPIETLALPATVQALLAARIDRLGEPIKQVLEAAAVIGHSFDEPLLAAVSGARRWAAGRGARRDPARGAAASRRLVAAARVPVQASADARGAYRAQLDERKARLHAAVAAALERLHADRLGEHAALIAYHWEASGMRFEAARWRRRAALKVSNIKVGGRRSTSPPPKTVGQ